MTQVFLAPAAGVENSIFMSHIIHRKARLRGEQSDKKGFGMEMSWRGKLWFFKSKMKKGASTDGG